MTECAGWRAGELMRTCRQSHASMGPADYLVAAVAEVNGLELTTLDVRHFPMVTGLERRLLPELTGSGPAPPQHEPGTGRARGAGRAKIGA